MEQATLLQMARLRTMAARKGRPFDVVRFASDRDFARDTLKSLLDTEDEELLVAGLQMMDTLKMIAPAHSTPKDSETPLRPLGGKPSAGSSGSSGAANSSGTAPATPAAAAQAPALNTKYIGRLR